MHFLFVKFPFSIALSSQILPKAHSIPFPQERGRCTLENYTLWTCSVKDGPIVQTSICCVNLQRQLSGNLNLFCRNSNEWKDKALKPTFHVNAGKDTDDFATFELSERICSVIRGLRGEHFHGMELMTTHTNHNHEELLENIDVYRFLGQITR